MRGHLFTQEISRKEKHTHGGQGREGVLVAETGDGVKGADLQFTMDKSWEVLYRVLTTDQKTGGACLKVAERGDPESSHPKEKT